MAIFRLTDNSIEALKDTTFAASGVKERGDLQRLLKSNIAAVAPDVLIISEEFSEWDDSKRRIDLLGINRLNANLVVIELKRDDDGGHMELQAIRYASMVQGMRFAKAIDVYQSFLNKHGGGDAQTLLLEYLHWEEPSEDDFARDVEIILVSADFSKEVTTAVLWLNERDLDIRCVRLRPYSLDKEIIVDSQQIIPLPETEAYTIKVKEKGQAIRDQERGGRAQLNLAFWQGLLPLTGNLRCRFIDRAPNHDQWIGVTSGTPGVSMVFVIWQNASGVEMYIDRDVAWNKIVYDALVAKKDAIEKTYKGSLLWQRLDAKRASRIRDDSVAEGINSQRKDWPSIYAKLIEAMKRLEEAVLPNLAEAVRQGQ